VEEPTDLSETVELRALFLKPADTEHLPQQLKAMVTVTFVSHIKQALGIQLSAVSFGESL
jgi:hypothetical protein